MKEKAFFITLEGLSLKQIKKFGGGGRWEPDFKLLNSKFINTFKMIKIFRAIHLVCIQKVKQPMITMKVMTEIEHVVVSKDNFK